MSDFRITDKEFEAFLESGRYTISDIDYGLNKETGEWNVPKIEWESDRGSFWETYESEEERTNAMDVYEIDLEIWVLKYRNEESKRKLKKHYENKKIESLKTLGGMFPELANLKHTL